MNVSVSHSGHQQVAEGSGVITRPDNRMKEMDAEKRTVTESI